MKAESLKLVTKRQFREIVDGGKIHSIDGDDRMYHLSPGYWVYDEMLQSLKRTGWVRFAPGFKAGLYGRAGCPYCLKILGMGVGENPLYFCERGYYLAHEGRMLERFRERGCVFGPEVLPPEAAIRLLVDEGGVAPAQAERRVRQHDVLAMECIRGVPLALQTGRYLNYHLGIVDFTDDLLVEVLEAMRRLRGELDKANSLGLLHNDPMPPNIIFGLDPGGKMTARLVDFEIAQDLNEPSPDFVNGTVAELYGERDVPRNTQTGKHTKNLDQHLMDESIRLVSEFAPHAKHMRSLADALDGVSLSIPILGGIGIDLGRIYQYLRRLRS